MEVGHTFGRPNGERLQVYVDPKYTVPDVVVVTLGDERVQFVRLEPASMYCHDVDGIRGSCDNEDCYKNPLGVCGCGRHHGRQPFVRARS